MKLKKQTIKGLAAILLASVTTFSFANNVEKEIRTLTGATKVSVSDGVKLNLTQGSNESITVMAPQGELPNVTTEVKSGVLRVNYLGDASQAKSVYVYVTLKSVDFIQVDNKAELTAYETISSDNLQFVCKNNSTLALLVETQNLKGLVDESSKVIVNGAAYVADISAANESNVEVNIQAQELKTMAENQAEIKLKGKTKTLVVKVINQSTLQASEMNAKSCQVDASEDSNVIVCTKKKASLIANGKSKITINGSPDDRKVMASDDSHVVFN